jgi:molybdopterin-guanine dinucleotide biosynthesis protein A
MAFLYPISDCSVVVMSGGQSRRMGDEKGLLIVEGDTFVQKALNLANQISDHVFLSVGTHNQNKFRNTQAKVIPDIENNFGPLGGIVSVLPHIQTNWFQLISVDAPQFSIEDFEKLYASKAHFDGVVYEYEGKIHPLLGLYTINTKEQWNAAFFSQKKKITNVLDELNINYLQAEKEQIRGLQNINTPEEYQLLISKTYGS